MSKKSDSICSSAGWHNGLSLTLRIPAILALTIRNKRMPPFTRIFVNGFPGLYGGAGTELHHQILAWLHLGMEVHLIPTTHLPEVEPLYNEMVNLGVQIHPCNEWNVIQPGELVIGFCNEQYLNNLHEIRRRTKRTIFVNCMTWLFPKEKERMGKGEIAMFLYQNEDVLKHLEPQLRALNDDPTIRFKSFKPYFDTALFPFHHHRTAEHFGCGRISRQDADKFAKSTLHIYDYFVSPKSKRGWFLGFDERSETKIGKPHDWIQIAKDHGELSQQKFYKHCEIILQPTDKGTAARMFLKELSDGLA